MLKISKPLFVAYIIFANLVFGDNFNFSLESRNSYQEKPNIEVIIDDLKKTFEKSYEIVDFYVLNMREFNFRKPKVLLKIICKAKDDLYKFNDDHSRFEDYSEGYLLLKKYMRKGKYLSSDIGVELKNDQLWKIIYYETIEDDPYRNPDEGEWHRPKGLNILESETIAGLKSWYRPDAKPIFKGTSDYEEAIAVIKDRIKEAEDRKNKESLERRIVLNDYIKKHHNYIGVLTVSGTKDQIKMYAEISYNDQSKKYFGKFSIPDLKLNELYEGDHPFPNSETISFCKDRNKYGVLTFYINGPEEGVLKGQLEKGKVFGHYFLQPSEK